MARIIGEDEVQLFSGATEFEALEDRFDMLVSSIVNDFYSYFLATLLKNKNKSHCKLLVWLSIYTRNNLKRYFTL